MTTANKITIFRVLLIPVMIVFMTINSLGNIQFLWMDIETNRFIIALIFVIASLTDFIDGYVARKYNQITTFGKFLDPIADKVLVLTAMIFLVVENPTQDIAKVTIWAVMIVIIREFTVTGIRLVAVDKGTVIAASIYGKIKTVLTMIALILMLFNDFGVPYQQLGMQEGLLGIILWYAAIFFTILSGWDYFYKNKESILKTM